MPSMKKKALGATAVLAALSTLAIVPMPAEAQGTSQKQSKSIVEVASSAGTFNTLIAALKAAGLVETLNGPGPFTVFAPTDQAFEKLPAGTVESLLGDKEKLTAILTYHVVPGKVMAADIVRAKGAKPATANGQALEIVVRDGKVYVNGAQVVTADVAASNGVIHVIDAVLPPASLTGSSGR